MLILDFPMHNSYTTNGSLTQAANGFMLIVECSQAKILFVSDTITDVLQEKPERWVGSCLYDMLHQKVIVMGVPITCRIDVECE